MAEVNWGLGMGGNALQGAAQLGAQFGAQLKQQRQEQRYSNALSGIVANPQAEDAQILEWTKGLPGNQVSVLLQLQNQRRQQAAQQDEAQVKQRRADLPMLGRLLQSANDEPSYQQARQVAQQYGIDLSSAPATFDPAWREQQLSIVTALQTPQGQESMSNAGKQAIDMGYRPGTPEYNQAVTQLVTASLAQPYTGAQGETRLYTPQIGQPQQAQPGPVGIPDAAIAALRSGEGTAEQFDALFGPGAAAKAMGNQMSAPQAAGGQTRQPSGGFR